MDYILQFFSSSFSYIIPTIILLGVLIFIHELGHFLVAKYFNVKVETFSLGFGPKLLKFKWGETVYCVSAIPFGGYVKMYGDEVGGDVPEPLKHRSFLHKPIPQRIAIALAGPLMNLFLTFFLFIIIATTGEKAIAPILGDFSKRSAAYSAGFRPGDKILNINNHTVTRWEEVESIIEDSLDVELKFLIERESLGDPITVLVTPKAGKSRNPILTGEVVGSIEGFHFLTNGPLMAISDPKSLLAAVGLRTGDKIVSVNSVKVTAHRHLAEVLFTEALSQESVELSIERFDLNSKQPTAEPEELKIIWDLAENPLPAHPSQLELYLPETIIGDVVKGSPAETAGLKKGDRIKSINGEEVESFDDILSLVGSYDPTSNGLSLSIERQGEQLDKSLTPKATEVQSPEGIMETRYTVGVKHFPFRAPHLEEVQWKAASFGDAVTWAVQKTVFFTYATLKSFVLLIKRKVSSKHLGGFIAIGQMAQKSWSMGLDAFLRVMAIISINLFVLNLLPVPVLDGGHILIFTIEAIKGKPLSLQTLAKVQQAGLFLLLSLMAFTLFNDVSRLFG